MNLTQQPQHVRRRGSSLEEGAIRASLNQGLLKLEASSQSKGSNFTGYDSDNEKQDGPNAPAGRSSHNQTLPLAPRRLSVSNISQSAQSTISVTVSSHSDDSRYLLTVRGLVLLMLVANLFGFAFRGVTYILQRQTLDEIRLPEQSSVEDLSLSLSERMEKACLKNSTYCPQLPKNVFTRDWAMKGKSQKGKMLCYTEEDQYTPSCESNCELLFRKNSNNTISSLKIAAACQVGCAYAKREKQDASKGLTAPNCLYDCRNTVWVSLPGKSRKCNYDKGLGLLTTEYERKFGSGVFGASKACEAGCILGNARICQHCDLELTISNKY